MEENSRQYHTPVMLQACLDFLQIKPEGIYVDATFGGGGHSKPILDRLGTKGFLVAFDQDREALLNVIYHDRFELFWSNYKYLEHFLEYRSIQKVDGILADLGVSSHQFDEGGRGFSFRQDAQLDMRMNEAISITAKEVLNQYDVDLLQKMFSEYGEVRNAKTLAQSIVETRGRQPFDSILSLVMLLEKLSIGDRRRYMAQVFQSLRIEVNDELNALRDFLRVAISFLDEGARLVVMSYHSLEDRLVKEVFREYVEKYKEGEIDFTVSWVTKKPLTADDEECKLNPRARSAKLRVIEKRFYKSE